MSKGFAVLIIVIYNIVGIIIILLLDCYFNSYTLFMSNQNNLGNNDTPGETLTMDTILAKGESIDSLEDIGREALESGTNLQASPTYGAYDDLD